MPPKGEMSALVQTIVKDARDKFAGDKALATAIPPLLGGFVYGASAISSWGSGRDRPSAETLLAIAKVADVRIDDYLYGKSVRAELEDVLERLKRLEEGEPGDA